MTPLRSGSSPGPWLPLSQGEVPIFQGRHLLQGVHLGKGIAEVLAYRQQYITVGGRRKMLSPVWPVPTPCNAQAPISQLFASLQLLSYIVKAGMGCCGRSRKLLCQVVQNRPGNPLPGPRGHSSLLQQSSRCRVWCSS